MKLIAYKPLIENLDWFLDSRNASSTRMLAPGYTGPSARFVTLKTPLRAFKKVRHPRLYNHTAIVELEIPVGAMVYSHYLDHRNYAASKGASVQKMRCSSAVVKAIVRSDALRNLEWSHDPIAQPETIVEFAAAQPNPLLEAVSDWGWVSIEGNRGNDNYYDGSSAAINVCDDNSPVWVSADTAPEDTPVIYRVGETVVPHNDFSYMPYQCESGVHFFMNIIDALEYCV